MIIPYFTMMGPMFPRGKWNDLSGTQTHICMLMVYTLDLFDLLMSPRIDCEVVVTSMLRELCPQVDR